MNRSRPTGVSMRSHYKEAKAFVERQLSMSLGGSEEAVIAALQDGTVLCRLCASLLPDLAMGKPKTPSKKVHFRGAAFENWDQFGKLCRKLQVDESFIISMSALADSGSGNTRPVWRCIVEIKSVSGVGAPRPAPTPAKEATLGDAVGFADEASAAAPPAAEAAVVVHVAAHAKPRRRRVNADTVFSFEHASVITHIVHAGIRIHADPVRGGSVGGVIKPGS